MANKWLCNAVFWRRRRDFIALHFVPLERAARQSAGLPLARSRFACGSRSRERFVRIPLPVLGAANRKATAQMRWLFLEEKERFEPSRRFPGLRPQQGRQNGQKQNRQNRREHRSMPMLGVE